MCRAAVALSPYHQNMPLNLYWMKRITPFTLLSQTANAIIHSKRFNHLQMDTAELINLLLITK
jgi:hypothetical protein